VASPVALQLLASLSRLTSLDLSGTAVAAGLQHLAALKGLASLSLGDCQGVKDKHLQPLSALTGLTSLDARDTAMQGGSLAALSSLRSLDIGRCSSMRSAALAAVAQLTHLTFLDISFTATEAGPAQLVQLAQLTSLQELRLWGHTIRQQAAALLELPCLGTLCADSVAVPPGQDLSGCAFTRLVLDRPAAADLQVLPQLPALQSLIICTGSAGLSGISVLTQLTELVAGSFHSVQGAELAAALRGLKQLQVLELSHAASFDRQCLLEVAGMRQLRQLWLDGGRQGLAPGVVDCLGMLHRCAELQQLTLQRCGPIPFAVLFSLVGGHPSMQRMALRGSDHSLTAEAAGDLRALCATFACVLLSEEVVCAGPRSEEFFETDV
jgi:Leucine-rich repeat (LRR) protein